MIDRGNRFARYPVRWQEGALHWRAIILGVVLFNLAAQPVFGLDAKKKVRHYVKTIYNEKQGLPQSSVMTITQTPDGYYWLGTQDGLARFDGVDFEIFDSTNTPALTHGDIYNLYLDRSERLWISSRGGGVVIYENGRFETFTKKDKLIDENVLAVFEDSKGRIWFATNEGCTIMEPGGKIWNLTAQDGLPEAAVNEITEDRDGSIWIATDKGLVHWKGGAVSVYDARTVPALTVDAVRTFYLDSGGTLWLGTWGAGLVRYARGRFEKILSDRPKQMISAIVEDRDKNLWASLGDEGLGRVEDGRLVIYGKGDGLPTENGLSVFEDREGNLLLGLGPGGLVVLRDAAFTTYDTRDGLPDPSIRTVYQDSAGDMWIGLQADGLGLMRQGKISVLGTDAGIVGGTRSILERPEGGLYVASLKAGVFLVEQDRVTGTLSHNGKAIEVSVRDMLRASDGSIWFGTIDKGLFHQKGDDIKSYRVADGLASDRILSLDEGPDGTIWIGAWGGGLTRYRQGRFDMLEGPKVLESKAVTALQVDPDGTVWMGTYGVGLLCYKDGRFTNIRRSDGLADDTGFAFLEKDGDLWVTGNRGVYRVSKKELLDFVAGRIDRVHSESFGEEDGLKASECNGGAQPAAWKSRDGRLWFPTIAGLAVLDPDAIVPDKFVPPAFVTRFIVDGKEFQGDGKVRIGPGVDKLEIHYTAPTLSSPDKVTFRFRLKGFEKDWVDAGDRRVAYYTNLGPGSYRFHVIPVNADGVVGKKSATLAFEIVPAVWQTVWFRIAVLLAALGLVWGLVMLRVRGIKRRNILLEKKVAERTVELEQAHAQIVKLEKETVEKQMAGGFAHEIRNALAGAKLLVLQALRAGGDPESESINQKNSKRLTDLFLMLRSKLDKESLVEAAGIIKKVNGDEQRMDQVLSRALASVERSLSVTQRIMEYSGIGSEMPGDTDVKLHGVMAQILEEHRSRIEELDIEVDLNVAEDSVILGDEAHLLAIFGHLVTNAVDALADGGLGEKKRRMEIREVQASDERIVEVSDTGAGISEQEQKKIFEPFYTTKPHSGTGLGLGMAAKYLSLYDGRLEVSSEIGVGARFSVIFPETKEPAPSQGD